MAEQVELESASGIALQPFYEPREQGGPGGVPPAQERADAGGRLGRPGEYPFTRGLHATAYNRTPWMMQQVLGAGLAEHTREIMDRLVAEGMEGYFGHPVFNVVFDNPTKGGIDPDQPEAKGHVGVGGMSLSHLDDVRRLVRDLPLDRINLSLITGDTCLIALAMYIVAAEERGYRPEQLRGNSMNWLLKSFCVDNPDFPPRSAQRAVVQLIKYCTANMPAWNTTNLSGYLIREAGCNAVQELAFTLAWGIATVEACVEAGLAVDSFAPRMGFQIAFHNDLFEEVAKLRALRRMWATILRERFGAQNPKSMLARVHVHTAGDTLLAQQPQNNVVRVALQTLGAVLGGVQSVHTCAYTETLQIPNEEQARLALRTQQIVLHETNVPKVADPLGGSWYVEELTDQMEEAATRLIEEIDAMGGFVAAIESGWVKGQIVDQLIETHEHIEDGSLVRVGLNRYAVEEAPESRPAVFTIDPGIEAEAVRRITAWKDDRDQAAVRRTLEAVRAAAASDGALVEAIVEAVRAHATQGEIMDALKDVYGWGFVTG
jgi:methylmalonyl-CoA mutase N-terminal domain/subunit